MTDLGTPAHGLAFIRHIETAETYAHSPILIPVQARDKVARCQFEVVSVGGDEVCDDPGECERPHWPLLDDPDQVPYHRCDLKPGDWVLCRNRSWELTPDPDVFIVKQSDVIGKFVEA